MHESTKTTRIVGKVPAKYRDNRLRYWCAQCADSHDTQAAMGRHYSEHHPERLHADRGTWVKMRYNQTRHAGNESEWEDEEGGGGDVYDEQSDEYDAEEEDESDIQIGLTPGEADEDSEEGCKNDPGNQNPVSNMEQARRYFDLAAYGDSRNGILELTRRGVAKLREADDEVERRVGPSQEASDDEAEVKDKKKENLSGRRRGGRAGGSGRNKEEKDQVHPVAKASWNMTPYKG